MLNKYFRYFTWVFLVALFFTNLAGAQIYQHDFGTTTISTHPYTVAPPTLAANLSGSSWSNSNTTWTSLAGSTGQAITLTSANNKTITLSVTIASGYQVEISSFSFWRQRSSSGPQNWAMTINGTPAGSGNVPTTGATTGNIAVNPVVSGITGTLSVVLSLSGASGNGNFRLDDFTLNGRVTPTCAAPVIAGFLPASGPQNTRVTLTGSGFTGATAVTFGSVPATSYNVVSDTQITAIVPAGAGNTVNVTNAAACTGTALTNFTLLTSTCPQPPTEIYISEVYDEDLGDPGAIELYNPTATTVVLDGVYVLERYGNINDPNPTTGYTIPLTGSIAPYSTYLVRCGTQASACLSTLVFGPSRMSGINDNDAIKLRKNAIIIDVVNAPGNTGYSIIRNANAIAPAATYAAADWATSNTESCANLGMHTANSSILNPPSAAPLADATACSGANGVFSLQVTPAGTYTYQWKTLSPAGAWVNVVNGVGFSGATTATLTVISPTVALNGSQYYCQITTSACTVYSYAARLNVDAAPAAPTATPQQPDCSNSMGSITVTPVNAATYSIDGINYQTSNVFNNLVPGNYPVTVKNAGGCVSSPQNVTINTVPSAPAAPVVNTQQPDCTTVSGGITITPVSGMTYSINGTTYSTTTSFTGLAPGTYPVTARNAAGCASPATSVTINPAPEVPTAPNVVVTQPDCITATGIITVTTVTGYTYSIDGTNYQANNTFNGVNANTYNVTSKSASGCISPVVQVTVNTPPATPAAPLVNVTQPICATPTGTITVTPVSGVTYSIDDTNYVASNIFTGVAPGVYAVTVKSTAGCISAPASATVSAVPAAPAAPVITTQQPDCTTATGTITITPVSGVTYSIDGTNYVANNIFSGLVPNTYNVTVKNSAGCISQATPATINTVPSAPAAPGVSIQNPTCTQPTGTITVTAVSGATYSIDGINYVANNIFSALGANTYSVTVKSSAGCISPATSATVTAAPAVPAAPSASATQQPNCTAPTGTITITPVTGLTYSVDGITYTTNNVFTGLASGNYNVTVKNAAGCTSAATPITINPLNGPAQPVTSVQQPTCAVGSGTITVAPVTGVTYSIDGTNYVANNVFSGLVPGTYTVTVRNASGCVSPPRTVVINSLPTAPAAPVVTVTNPGCNGSTGSISVTVMPGVTYSINGINYGPSAVFTNLAPGSYTVTVRNAAGCVSPGTPAVIQPAPGTPAQPLVTVNQPDCTTATGTITVTPVTGVTYSIDGRTYTATNTFTNLTRGTYYVTIKNSAGCISPAQSVIINAAPATPAAPLVSVRQPDCTTRTGSITVNPVFGLQYSIDGINYQSSATFTNLAAGTYAVTAQNAAGCVSAPTTVTIDAAPALPATPAAITGNIIACVGETVQYANTVTGGIWSVNNTRLATIDQNGLLTTLLPGRVVITYTTGTVCTASATTTLDISGLPDVRLATEYYLCKDLITGQYSTITINTGLSAANHTFVWEKDGQTLTATTPFLEITETGNYKVTVTNNGGCTDTATTVVKESSKAIAYAEAGLDFHTYQTVTVYTTGGSGSYLYSLDGGSYQSSPIFTGVTQGLHTVTVKDENGCGEIVLEVFVLDYPKFFTPNGDGANDTWQISGLRNQPQAIIYIFDRYGKLITSLKPSSRGWDGTLNGHDLPSTDYWFTVLYKNILGQDRQFKAHFSLVR